MALPPRAFPEIADREVLNLRRLMSFIASAHFSAVFIKDPTNMIQS
jgi:hypothetical protein